MHGFIMENINFKNRIAYFKYFLSNCFSISKFKKFHLPFTYSIKSDFNLSSDQQKANSIAFWRTNLASLNAK